MTNEVLDAMTTTTTDVTMSSNNANANSSGTSASDSLPVCATVNCNKQATLACPTCLSLNLPPTRFCSQECFKSSWKEHNAIHKEERNKRDYKPPPFDYTGHLRPAYVTPARTVPTSISKPDYAESGIPLSELRLRGTNQMIVYTKEEIAGIRRACQIGREILDYAHTLVRPGITTEEIDRLVHEKTLSYDAYPSPLNYNHFPKSCCTSINEIICHGIPDVRPLQEGDIVNIDISVYKDGFHGDLNETFPVGKVDDASVKLIKCSYDSMMAAIDAVKPGAYCRDFGDIISRFTNKQGFSVVRSYCGHGIGRLFHCAPNIPHYKNNKAVGVCKEGMIFTIEPMINAGSWHDVTWPDDWTSATADGKRSAQFEHTILVTKNGYEILTARTADSPKFVWEK